MIACRGRGLGQARVLQELGVGGADLGLTGPLAHSFVPMILQGTDVGLILGPWLDLGAFRGYERGFFSGAKSEACLGKALLA